MGRLLSRYRMAVVVVAVLTAAVASGTVNLRWSAVWWVAGGIALIGIWHAATDIETGKRIAESRASKWGLAILLAGSGLLAIHGPPKWEAVFLGVNVTLALACLSVLAAWLFRNRWAGPLVLRIGESDDVRRIALVINVSGMFFNFFNVIFPRLRAHHALELPDLAFLFWMVAILVVLWLSTRQEIRRDGFINLGRLIRWGRIAYWMWEADDQERAPIALGLGQPPAKPILALHLHHAVKFLPDVRFRIPTWQKEQVEAILVRQLGQWPPGI